MANETPLIEGFSNAKTNTVEIAYLASKDTLITAFTVTNNTGVNRSYKAYIYDSVGNASGAVQPRKFVTAIRGFDLAPAIVGHIVRKGGTIRVESSAAGSLVFRASGQLIG